MRQGDGAGLCERKVVANRAFIVESRYFPNRPTVFALLRSIPPSSLVFSIVSIGGGRCYYYARTTWRRRGFVISPSHSHHALPLSLALSCTGERTPPHLFAHAPLPFCAPRDAAIVIIGGRSGAVRAAFIEPISFSVPAHHLSSRPLLPLSRASRVASLRRSHPSFLTRTVPLPPLPVSSRSHSCASQAFCNRIRKYTPAVSRYAVVQTRRACFYARQMSSRNSRVSQNFLQLTNQSFVLSFGTEKRILYRSRVRLMFH